MLTFQNLDRTSVELPGLNIAAVDYEADLAKFDLQVTLWDSAPSDSGPTGLTVALTYAADLFDTSTMVRFGERFVRVLRAVTAAPAEAVGEIDLLDPVERKSVLAFGSGPVQEIPGRTTLVDQFDARVAQTSDAQALVFEDVRLTYAELDARANHLSRH